MVVKVKRTARFGSYEPIRGGESGTLVGADYVRVSIEPLQDIHSFRAKGGAFSALNRSD